VHRQLPHDLAAAPFVFHCDSKRGELGEMPAARELDVAIVGGGESALSCMAFLREFRPNARVTVYTPGLPLSRGESFLENRAFSNPDEIGWSSLSLQMRRDFIKHCDRGVFDVRSLATFAADERCTFRTGRVLHIGAAGAGVFVDYLSGSEPDALRARHDYAVNCTGFDLLAQMHGLFDERSRTEIERRTGALWSRTPGEELPIGRALELTGLRPRLHVPGLGALSQGPGFANLGCLGLLANRVLQPLVVERETPSQRRSAPIDTSVPAES
jgi:mycobactin lysine-N-oxygenase